MKSVLGVSGITLGVLIGATQLRPVNPPDFAGFIRRVNPLSSQRTSCERNSSTCLKTITSAQADFRANDRDGDGINQFWRGDIAGLYTLVPGNQPEMVGGYWNSIKLIELSVAAADDRPITNIHRFAATAPKAGYWFRALRHADEDPKALDPNRFAACAFPACYSSQHHWTYIVDENDSIFRRDLGRGGGIEIYPPNEELRTLWTQLD